MKNWNYTYPRPLLKRDSFLSLNGTWLLNDIEIEIPIVKEFVLDEYALTNSKLFIYKKEFNLPLEFAKKNQRLFLHFGPIYQKHKIYLNGNLLSSSNIPNLDCEIEVTSNIERKNTIEVLIYKDKDFLGISKLFSSNVYSAFGIWQSVWLEAVPEHYIKGISIENDTNKLVLDIDSDESYFKITIPINKRKKITHEYETNHIEFDLNEIENKNIWTTDKPYIYSLFIETNEDKIETHFSIRSQNIVNNCFYLNGIELIIKGVVDDNTYSNNCYLPIDPLNYYNDLLKIKELGFNSIYFKNTIVPQTLYYACEKMGFLVFQELDINNIEFLINTIYEINSNSCIAGFVVKSEKQINELKNYTNRLLVNSIMNITKLINTDIKETDISEEKIESNTQLFEKNFIENTNNIYQSKYIGYFVDRIFDNDNCFNGLYKKDRNTCKVDKKRVLKQNCSL